MLSVYWANVEPRADGEAPLRRRPALVFVIVLTSVVVHR
ncbi:hypothetical protein SCAB_2521 [Streptomyces scabiei 87.22]|uniref:Uncharacterized protein n=1 Tax=Streptomyces scabiei (strain 87.22) TaxID=680198 RepID=C9ZEK7_STRSW|nr:hypothetical protein SCAB_2521 [Streptomyces scabiei 87.22]